MFLIKLHNSKDPGILDDTDLEYRFGSFLLSVLVSCMSHSCRRHFGVSVFMHNSVMSRFLIGDKQEAKFGGVMSAQNTHHIPAFYRFFDSCHLVISAFIVIYLILSFLCI